MSQQPSSAKTGARKISRRAFITAAVSVPLGASTYGFLIEPRRLAVSRHVLGRRSASAATLRMVQISDLHLQEVTRYTRAVAQKVNQLRPDIVLFTGDMIDRADRVQELTRFLRLLDPSCAKYASLGNWEHWGRIDFAELRAGYDVVGCRLLVNETVRHRHGAHEVLLTGLDDWTGGTPDLPAALTGVKPGPLHIVLAHSPVYRDVMAQELAKVEAESEHVSRSFDIAAVLSGHTHGGQVALFGWAPVRPPGSGRYVAGWYRDASPALYVSRGIGTSLAPVRFGAPPEIAVFDCSLG